MINIQRDGNLNSIWQPALKRINTNDKPYSGIYNVAIIGAGITGLSTALNLQRAGKRCIIIEAANICFGTSGGTTAHLNNFFDTPYGDIIKDFGEKEAKLLAEGAKEAINTVKENINTNGIECGFEEKTAYLFAVDDKQVKILDDIAEGAAKVGVEMKPETQSPFPIPFEKVVAIPGQAQFHPVKYLTALAEKFIEAGGLIIDNCRATDIDQEKDHIVVNTSDRPVKAQNVVYATHLPPGNLMMHLRNAPYRSYAIAVTLDDDAYPEDLGYDLYDPYHYYRSQEIDGKMYLIAGGEDHKTGHDDNTQYCFTKLEDYFRGFYKIKKVNFRWSSQYYEPVDGLPYIGKINKNENVFVATGYSGNGMIYGTLAGNILRDLIVNGESRYEKLFSPSRVKPVAGFSAFVKENADVVKSLISDKINIEKIDSLASIANNEGKLIKYEGHSLAVYRDVNGKLHILNSTCTHLGCNVKWNSAERSWDCPCHGSRFNIEGRILTGPARENLEKLQEKELQ